MSNKELFEKHYHTTLKECPDDAIIVRADGSIQTLRMSAFGMRGLHIISGSFNPLHEGHRFMHDNAGTHPSEYQKTFEISVSRVGKTDLSCEEMYERIKQFEGYANICVTRAARFVEKCAVFSGCDGEYGIHWHIGVDTIQRMRDDYGELGIGGLPGKFVVYEREINGKVESWPLDFKHKARNVLNNQRPVPKHLLGISSTRIRNGETF